MVLAILVALTGCAALHPSPVTTSVGKIPVPLDARSRTGEWFLVDQSQLRGAELDEILWVRIGQEVRQDHVYLQILASSGSSNDGGDVPGKSESEDVLMVRFNTAKAEPLADATLPSGVLPILRSARKVVVEGHTDSTGAPAANRQLAARRAQAVSKWLVAHGVQSERIEIVSVGAAAPLASNKTSEGRRQNRRAVVRLDTRPSAITD